MTAVGVATPSLITPAALRTAKWTLMVHLNMGRVHVTNRTCVDFPGLQVSDSYDRKARQTTRTFFVEGDEREFDHLHDAVRAWNDQRRLAPTIPLAEASDDRSHHA